jgi:hypothetical protein
MRSPAVDRRSCGIAIVAPGAFRFVIFTAAGELLVREDSTLGRRKRQAI